jgi:hypothetical protein
VAQPGLAMSPSVSMAAAARPRVGAAGPGRSARGGGSRGGRVGAVTGGTAATARRRLDDAAGWGGDGAGWARRLGGMGSATGRDGLGDGAGWGGDQCDGAGWVTARDGFRRGTVATARDLGEILGFGASGGLRKILSKKNLAGTKISPAHPLFCPLSQ